MKHSSRIGAAKAVAVLAIAAATLFSSMQQTHAAAVRTAYQVTLAYYDSWGIPHYGAFFTGYNGLGYSWLCGYSGPPYPNWWGNSLAVALISKTWLFTTYNSWTPSCHQGVLQY
jgi:hypothetical protein